MGMGTKKEGRFSHNKPAPGQCFKDALTAAGVLVPDDLFIPDWTLVRGS